MKWSITTVCATISLFGLCATAQTNRPDNPFQARSDNGELVHILPTPAAVNAPPQMVNAPPSNGATVYRASYGIGSLRNHGGPEIPNAAFRAVYWNSMLAGTANTTAPIAQQINSFINAFSGSPDYTIIQQYSYGSTPIAATLSNTRSFTDAQASASTISDTQIQNYLAALFSNINSGVNPDPKTLYGVYFPTGMQVTMGNSASCTNFCGYHSNFSYSGVTIKYAVFPYPDCSGCTLSGKSAADMLTIISSHEIREAVTDSLGTAWYDFFGYEADDKCAWHNLYQMKNGGFWVQPEYSNGLNGTPGPGCVVP